MAAMILGERQHQLVVPAVAVQVEIDPQGADAVAVRQGDLPVGQLGRRDGADVARRDADGGGERPLGAAAPIAEEILGGHQHHLRVQAPFGHALGDEGGQVAAAGVDRSAQRHLVADVQVQGLADRAVAVHRQGSAQEGRRHRGIVAHAGEQGRVGNAEIRAGEGEIDHPGLADVEIDVEGPPGAPERVADAVLVEGQGVAVVARAAWRVGHRGALDDRLLHLAAQQRRAELRRRAGGTAALDLHGERQRGLAPAADAVHGAQVPAHRVALVALDARGKDRVVDQDGLGGGEGLGGPLDAFRLQGHHCVLGHQRHGGVSLLCRGAFDAFDAERRHMVEGLVKFEEIHVLDLDLAAVLAGAADGVIALEGRPDALQQRLESPLAGRIVVHRAVDAVDLEAVGAADQHVGARPLAHGGTPADRPAVDQTAALPSRAHQLQVGGRTAAGALVIVHRADTGHAGQGTLDLGPDGCLAHSIPSRPRAMSPGLSS